MRLRKSICLLLVLLFCFSSVGLCTPTAQIVEMSMEDYLSLKNELLMLRNSNEEQAKLLQTLKEQVRQSQKMQELSGMSWTEQQKLIDAAQQRIDQLLNRCNLLETQLTNALQASKQAESGLSGANQSLSELSKAIKQERAKADRQILILKVITGAAIIYAGTR